MYGLDAWEALGAQIDLGGHRVFVVDSGGTGRDTVFLIHGFPTASWDWAHVWDALSERYRLVTLDLLGYGFSDKPAPHDYRIEEQADLCEALVERLNLDSFHVIAHDYGDTVAQELLARQNAGSGAGRWRSLLLLNGGLFPETHRPRAIQRLLLSPLGPVVNRLVSERVFARNLAAVFGPDTQPSKALLADYWTLLNFGGRRAPFHELIRYMAERVQHRSRWVGALRDSVVPIGVLNGSLDPISGAHMVDRYRELIDRDDDIIEWPDIGHFPQVEAPGRFAEACLTFFGRIERGRQRGS